MRRIIAGFAASLDGYIAGTKGEYDWILVDKEVDFAAYARRFDTYLYGRKTFEMVLAQGVPPSKKHTHIVFSKTLTSVPPGYRLSSHDVAKELLALKEQPGKDIAVFGGAALLASLLQLQMVDELTVSVIPVLLGSGKPMADTLQQRTWLQLSGTKTYSNGTVQLTYVVKNKDT